MTRLCCLIPKVGKYRHQPPPVRRLPEHWPNSFGLLADVYASQFFDFLAFNPPNVFTSVIHQGLLEARGTGSAPAIAAASANAFQTGFAGGATFDQLSQSVAPVNFQPPTYYSVPTTLRTPRYLEYNLEFQRQFGVKNALTLRYMGNYGYDILESPTRQ
jgi:hypothetical protein